MARLDGHRKNFKKNFETLKKMLLHVNIPCDNGFHKPLGEWIEYEGFNDRLSLRENLETFSTMIMHWKLSFFW